MQQNILFLTNRYVGQTEMKLFLEQLNKNSCEPKRLLCENMCHGKGRLYFCTLNIKANEYKSKMRSFISLINATKLILTAINIVSRIERVRMIRHFVVGFIKIAGGHFKPNQRKIKTRKMGGGL